MNHRVAVIFHIYLLPALKVGHSGRILCEKALVMQAMFEVIAMRCRGVLLIVIQLVKMMFRSVLLKSRRRTKMSLEIE